MRRKVDGEPRAKAGLAVGEDEPARLLDEAVDRRKPEPGALALLLGGEERLEDLAQVLGRDAAAVVLDHERGIIARGHDVGAAMLEIARDRDPAGGDRDPPAPIAAITDRVARVDREVDDHLLELRRIGAHRRRGRGRG